MGWELTLRPVLERISMETTNEADPSRRSNSIYSRIPFFPKLELDFYNTNIVITEACLGVVNAITVVARLTVLTN